MPISRSAKSSDRTERQGKGGVSLRELGHMAPVLSYHRFQAFGLLDFCRFTPTPTLASGLQLGLEFTATRVGVQTQPHHRLSGAPAGKWPRWNSLALWSLS